jgi:hypothetical protein
MSSAPCGYKEILSAKKEGRDGPEVAPRKNLAVVPVITALLIAGLFALADAALIAVVSPAPLTFPARDALVVMALTLASGVLPLPSLLIAATVIASPSHGGLLGCVLYDPPRRNCKQFAPDVPPG